MKLIILTTLIVLAHTQDRDTTTTASKLVIPKGRQTRVRPLLTLPNLPSSISPSARSFIEDVQQNVRNLDFGPVSNTVQTESRSFNARLPNAQGNVNIQAQLPFQHTVIPATPSTGFEDANAQHIVDDILNQDVTAFDQGITTSNRATFSSSSSPGGNFRVNAQAQLPRLPQVIPQQQTVQNNFAQTIRQQIPQVTEVVTSVLSQMPKVQLESYLNDAWENFKRRFNKVYTTVNEETYRKEVFIENVYKIERLNQDYANGRSSFSVNINPYADMLHHEFNEVLNGFNRGRNRRNVTVADGSAFIPSANVAIPDSIDWRELGAVTSVRQQGKCGGCYAFSAAGAIEGQNFRKTGKLEVLSPQNIIDCTIPYENDGCLGGLMEPAFQYVQMNPGIDTEASYPYEERNFTCRFKQEGVGAITTGYVSIPEGDENALKVAVATIGPVSIGIDAGQESLQFYDGGRVYFDEKCGNTVEDVNHAVLVVGYGTDSDGKEYWLIKNSYGTEWGLGGYLKLARNAGNHCGVATIASYPLV